MKKKLLILISLFLMAPSYIFADGYYNVIFPLKVKIDNQKKTLYYYGSNWERFGSSQSFTGSKSKSMEEWLSINSKSLISRDDFIVLSEISSRSNGYDFYSPAFLINADRTLLPPDSKITWDFSTRSPKFEDVVGEWVDTGVGIDLSSDQFSRVKEHYVFSDTLIGDCSSDQIEYIVGYLLISTNKQFDSRNKLMKRVNDLYQKNLPINKPKNPTDNPPTENKREFLLLENHFEFYKKELWKNGIILVRWEDSRC